MDTTSQELGAPVDLVRVRVGFDGVDGEVEAPAELLAGEAAGDVIGELMLGVARRARSIERRNIAAALLARFVARGYPTTVKTAEHALELADELLQALVRVPDPRGATK